jgi:hypothetical protein
VTEAAGTGGGEYHGWILESMQVSERRLQRASTSEVVSASRLARIDTSSLAVPV